MVFVIVSSGKLPLTRDIDAEEKYAQDAMQKLAVLSKEMTNPVTGKRIKV